MHCDSMSKLRRFFLSKLRCSPKKKKKKKKKKKVCIETETVFWQWCAPISRLFAQINRPFARIFDDFRRFEPNGGATAPPPPTAMGLEAVPPALKNFACFCKNNLILGLF